MTRSKDSKAPEILSDVELEDAAGGFEAWPAKWHSPALKEASDPLSSSDGSLSLKSDGMAAGPLIAKSLCNNEVIE